MGDIYYVHNPAYKSSIYESLSNCPDDTLAALWIGRGNNRNDQQYYRNVIPYISAIEHWRMWSPATIAVDDDDDGDDDGGDTLFQLHAEYCAASQHIRRIYTRTDMSPEMGDLPIAEMSSKTKLERIIPRCATIQCIWLNDDSSSRCLILCKTRTMERTSSFETLTISARN